MDVFSLPEYGSLSCRVGQVTGSFCGSCCKRQSSVVVGPAILVAHCLGVCLHRVISRVVLPHGWLNSAQGGRFIGILLGPVCSAVLKKSTASWYIRVTSSRLPDAMMAAKNATEACSV